MAIKKGFPRNFSFGFLILVVLGTGIMDTPAFAGDCPQTRKTQQAPAEIYNQTNPLPSTPENIGAGELLYQKDAKPLACAQCHGPQGDGKGVLGGTLTPKARDFTCVETMNTIPDGQLFWIIKNGSSGTGMMAFKGLKDEQVWQMVHYLRSLAK